jgi:hypothetical protein
MRRAPFRTSRPITAPISRSGQPDPVQAGGDHAEVGQHVVGREDPARAHVDTALAMPRQQGQTAQAELEAEHQRVDQQQPAQHAGLDRDVRVTAARFFA